MERIALHVQVQRANAGALRLLAIKLAALFVLALLLRQVPMLVGYTSPINPALFGRYMPKYFLMMLAYLGMTALWAALTIWLVWRLDEGRLARVRGFLGRNLGWVLGAFGLFSLAVLAFRSAKLSRQLIFNPLFPEAFDQAMKAVPSLAYVGFVALVALVVDRPMLGELEKRLLEGRLSRLRPDERAGRVMVGVALAILAGTLVGFVLRQAYWQFPLGVDPATHVYLGRHVLNGGIPYQTILYSKPPSRFALSLLWNAGADVTGLPLVPFIRGLDLALAVGVLAIAYGVGRELTGRAIGGLLAATLLLGTENLNELLVRGPTFRLTTLLFLLLGLWLAQRRRWLWAGVVTTLAATLWQVAVVGALAVVLAALLSERETRDWRPGVQAIGGAFLTLAVVAIALGLAGALQAAYRQTVLGVVALLLPGSGGAASGGPFGVNPSRFSFYVPAFKWVLRGEWELVVLMGAGLLVSVVRLKNSLRDIRVAPLMLAAVFMAGATLVNFDGSVRDVVMLAALFAPFGALAVTDILSRLDLSSARLRALAEAIVLIMVVVIGLSDTPDHQRFLLKLANFSLEEQQRMAQELAQALGPQETVQSFGSLWYQSLAGRDNPTPFIQWNSQANASARAAGWTFETMVEAVEAEEPVVVMLWPAAPDFQPPEVVRWLDEHYVLVGEIEPESPTEQQIYVRVGHDDVAAVIAAWPLVGSE